MNRPDSKDYGINVGFKNDVPMDIIGYNTALKEYIDYLELEALNQSENVVLDSVSGTCLSNKSYTDCEIHHYDKFGCLNCGNFKKD